MALVLHWQAPKPYPQIGLDPGIAHKGAVRVVKRDVADALGQQPQPAEVNVLVWDFAGTNAVAACLVDEEQVLEMERKKWNVRAAFAQKAVVVVAARVSRARQNVGPTLTLTLTLTNPNPDPNPHPYPNPNPNPEARQEVGLPICFHVV